jgi:hypothetical protein
MKYLWIALALVSSAFVSAENLGSLVYNLPAAAKDWAVYKQTANDNYVMVAYAPKSGDNTNNQNPVESFVVSLTTQPLTMGDEATIESNFNSKLPQNAKVKVNFIDRGTSNMVYEWTITEENATQAFGLTRAFSLRNGGTAMIQYITQNPTDIEGSKAVWLPALKDAKLQ